MITLWDALLDQIEAGDVILVLVLVLTITCGIAALLRRRPGPIGAWLDRYARLAWQFGVVLGLEQAYEFTRGRIPLNTDLALMNAYRLLDLEWRHGLFVESRTERFFLQFGTLMNGIDLFYLICHVVVTIGVLAWLYVWRREHYPAIRNLLMLTTGLALIVFYLYPTAPPRMLGNYGFVDPLQLHHLIGAGGAQPGSYTYNPYAAMPSLHVAYAIVSAWGVIIAARRAAVRAIAVAYPFSMGVVVIVSGNHWLLDVAGAFITVALAQGMLMVGDETLGRVCLLVGRRRYATVTAAGGE